MGVSGQCHAPAALLPPGKGPPVPIGQEAGWAPEPVWTQRLQEKSFAPAGNRTPVVQPVVRHFTAWANPAPLWILYFWIYYVGRVTSKLYGSRVWFLSLYARNSQRKSVFLMLCREIFKHMGIFTCMRLALHSIFLKLSECNKYVIHMRIGMQSSAQWLASCWMSEWRCHSGFGMKTSLVLFAAFLGSFSTNSQKRGRKEPLEDVYCRCIKVDIIEAK
jgi:hypothetical protein